MPRIDEYNAPEIQSQGPVGGISPNIEAAGMVGRSIERFGAAIGEAGDIIDRTNTRKEESDLNARFSQARADWTTNLNKKLQAGTLNVDQFKTDYEDYVNKIGENVQTAGGRNYFQRMSSRLGGDLLQSAARGQATIAGEKAKANYQTATDNDVQSLFQDPTQFKSVLDARSAWIDQQPELQGKADILKNQSAADLSKAALRGWMRIDPNVAEKKLNEGEFKDNLKGDAVYQMYGEIKQFQRAAEADKVRQEKLLEDARQARVEDWGQKALPQLTQRNLPAKAVLDNKDMSVQEKEHWLGAIEKSNREADNDPQVENSINRRLVLPDNDPNKITRIEQVMPYLGNGISLSKMEQFNSWIEKKSPEGQAMSTQRQQLSKYMKDKLVSSNPMLGIKDPEGELNLSQATNDLQMQEAAIRKAGGNVNDLYDPTKATSFWNQMPKYIKSPQQVMSDLAKGAQQPPPGEDLVPVESPTGAKQFVKRNDLDKAKAKGFKERKK